MDLGKEKLNSRDVDLILFGWEAIKPKEPHSPEPLFVWPEFFGVRYFIRVWKWQRKMHATSWSVFHQRYQQWLFMIADHYSLLAGEQDRYQEPQLMRLWQYQTNAQLRLRENSISQREWNQQNSNHI